MTAPATPASTPFPHPSPRPRPRPGPLLVATDGRGGAGALRTARRLAGRTGAEVAVLAVSEPLPVYFGGVDLSIVPPELDADREADLRERVLRQLDQVLGPGVTWPVEVRTGDPALVIADAARERHAALVLVGAGHHRLVDRLLADETALRVVRHADRPVLAVPEDYDAEPRAAVVATDFSPAAAWAAEVALALVADGGAVHLVHAWNPAALTSGLGAAPAAVQRVVDAYARDLPPHFERLRPLLGARPDVRVTTHVVQGRPAAEVLAYARAQEADLVAAGRHGRSFVEHLFVGSVTAALLRGASCPVLVTPAPSPADVERLERALTGASTGEDADAWRAQLDGFTRRNAGRRAVLRVDDRALGARTQLSGYPLLGVAYDPHDRRVAVMLGAPRDGGPHLTRTIGGVESVTVVAERGGAAGAGAAGGTPPGGERDAGLRIRHGRGATELAFLPDPPAAA